MLLVFKTNVSTLQTDVTSLQNSSGSSYNSILLLKKTHDQTLPNHSSTKITFNIVEHQSSDNKITYSNGDITVVDTGIYEITADISFHPDSDVPNDSGIREAFIQSTDHSGEKFGLDRRASPGVGTVNDYTRYTTTCFVKTTTENSILNLIMYQNNSDGDTINVFSHVPAVYSRLTCRRVA